MALVTVQRSPSPSASAETDEQDGLDTSDSNLKSPRQRSFSESYFTVKGAALILPQNDETVYTRRVTKSHGGDDIQSHLQAMFSTLRPQDTIKVAVKLEGEHTRYLAVVSCIGRQDTEESVVLGMDLLDKAHIGLVLPVWAHTHIKLDGDGGFTIQSESSNVHTFKPVSVQAMWSALQSLNKVLKIAKDQLYIPRGLSHTWVSFYEAKLTTESYLVSEWNASIDRDLSYRQDKGVLAENAAEEDIYKKIKLELKNVMMTVDLEEVTCLSLRIKIEEKMGMDLKKYKSFIDTQMMEILGQMDAPSMILDYLYLGSEWNASNLEELQINGVQHILNISREIDNFFPGILHYMNVREWDVEASDLLKYWEDTHKFINKSRKRGSKVLVHCKMGISRSGSTVIAYLMKEKQWSLQEALDFTKGKRSIVNPNPGFMKQLETYEGILTASWNKKIFDGLSGPDKEPMGQINESDEPLDMKLYPAPEDLLAARLGKDPLRDLNDPFLHTEDDIEIASRSADSTEDSLGDSQLSPETLQTVHARKQAYLVGAKHKDESNDYPSSDSSGFTDSDELSSDGDEDLAGNDDKLGSSKGFVPIDLPEVLVENVDVRLKKLAKVEAKRCKSEGDKGSLTVDEKMMSSFSREGSMSKFRADGSWIKPPDEDDDAEGEEGDAMEGKADVDEDVEKSESDIADMSSVEGGIWMTATTSEAADNASANIGGGTSSAAGNDKAKCKTEVVVAQAVVAVQETPKEEPSVDMEVDDIQKDQDEKGEHQYSRENIPWNPGTVLKQKQDIEERFGSIQGSTGAFRKTDSLEGSDTERVREIQSQGSSQFDDTQENVAKIPITIQNQQPVSIRIQSSEKEDVNQSAASCDIIDQSEKRKHEADQSEAEMRKSVYEEEEIELPEGIVRKTKQQIEERNRLSLESPRLKLKRSSSLKSNRVTPKSKDRDCERRRTCIVLLSPTHSGYPDFEGTSLQASSESDISSLRAAVDLCHGKALKSQASDDSDSDETRSGSVKVYKFMGEELTVEEGLVRKQTQDIESKAIEVIPKRKGETSPVSHEHCSTKSDTAHITIKQAPVISSGDESSTDNKTLSKYSPTSIRKEKLYPNMVTDTDDVQFRKSAESSSSASSTCSSYVTPKKHSVGQRPESRFDPATLALIREIGSALLNSPAKAELQEDDDVDIKQGESLVNHYVRKIEKNVGACGPRPKTRQIVIIDKDTSVGSDKSSSFSPVSSASPKTETDSRWSPRSKSRTSPSPGDTRKTPVAFDDKPISPKWSPVSVSRTRVLVSPKTVPVSLNTGSPDITNQKVSKKESGSPVSMETKASVATETTKTDDKACIDIEKQEACSVKDLRGKFEQPEQASGKVTPVHHSSVNTPPIPAGASSDRDTTSSSTIANHPALYSSSSGSNASSPPTMKSPSTLRTSVHRGQSFQGQSSSSQGQFEDQGQMSTRSPRQQRHSEPVIQLNPESLRLFEGQLKEIGSSIFTKTISSPTMEESSDICSGVANKSPASKAEGQQQQFPGARPKSAKGSRSEARPGQGRWSLGAKSGRGFLQHSKSVIESTDTQEEQFTWDGKKVRKSYGKSHPLAKLESNARQYMASSVRNNPFYSSM